MALATPSPRRPRRESFIRRPLELIISKISEWPMACERIGQIWRAYARKEKSLRAHVQPRDDLFARCTCGSSLLRRCAGIQSARGVSGARHGGVCAAEISAL